MHKHIQILVGIRRHEDSGNAFNGSGVPLVSKVGGHHRTELLNEEEKGKMTHMVAFDYGFITQENAGTLPTLMCRRSWLRQAEDSPSHDAHFPR